MVALYWIMQHYLAVSLVMVTFIIFLVDKFYIRRLTAKDIMTLVVLSTVSVVGRLILFFVPAFKPSTGIVIISGSIFGPVPGVLVGFMTGFVSNLAYGHGPWSPFQMLSWGLVGMISGIVRIRNRIGITVFGFIITILVYGLIMNSFTFISGGTDLTLQRYIFTLFAGLLYDVIHAFATALVLYFGWEPISKRLIRIRDKYKVLTN